MKIKELHLRNIASIEKADIDFEKDIIENGTSDPANIFLISGDTGTGKSVILDGISMALYKNTPRIVDAGNKKHNSFKDEYGTDIKINDIEQYSRLGISEKDECYSELVFEGNDNIVYRARLELGYTKTRTNTDANGQRHLKYREPKWMVKVGEKDWEKVASSGQPILDAVGLSFAQFGRMAMLAQGQFATFLTGDKEEREKILEQLTNTQKFSVYGTVISSLCSDAKNAKTAAENTYNVYKDHLLQPEEEENLKAELKELDKENTDIQERLNKVQETIKMIDGVGDCMSKKRASYENLERLKGTFMQLTADLKYREIEMAESRKSVDELNAWVEERKSMDAVYTKADAIVLQVKQFTETGVKIVSVEKLLKDEKSRTPELECKQKECVDKVTKARAEVNKKQEAIDALQKERNELNPTAVNQEIKTCSNRKTDLKNLQIRIQNVEENRLTMEASKAEIELEAKKLTELDSDLKNAQAALDVAERNAQEARALFATMQMSLDEKLTELRVRLTKTHANTCPLCGQVLDEESLKRDFGKMLTPIQEREEEANGKLAAASAVRDKAKTEYDTLKGAIGTKQNAYQKLVKDIDKEEKLIATEASKLGLNATEPIAGQIVDAIAKTEVQIAALEEKQKMAESIQNKISKLTQEKKPLDKNLSDAERLLSQAQNVVETNKKDISKYEKDLEEHNQHKENLTRDITKWLGESYPQWATETAEVMTRFSQDAREYCQIKKRAEEMKALNDKTEESITNARGVNEAILAVSADWMCEVEPQKAAVGDINRAWNQLHTDMTYDYRIIKNATEGIALLLKQLKVENVDDVPAKEPFVEERDGLSISQQRNSESIGAKRALLKANDDNRVKAEKAKVEFDNANAKYDKWNKINTVFGGNKFRTLVQTYILRPLLNNANIYLERITDRYTLTCSEVNEQLSIFVLDRYNKGQIRSVTVLSGGERFMISLALSLALSSLNRPDMNINILFIDEGFGTLDELNLNSVMSTLECLHEIAGQTERRVGIISHREELRERIPVKVNVKRKGEGRSIVEITN